MSYGLLSISHLFFGVTFVHTNLCMHISIKMVEIHFRLLDFGLLSLPVLNSMTDATTLVTSLMVTLLGIYNT